MAFGTVQADVIGTSVANTSLGAGNASIMKNRIINGAMVIAQYGTGSTTPTTSGYYSCDRWKVSVTTASKFSIQQSSAAPSGFTNSLLITSTSAYTPSSTDELAIQYRIEGYNVADLDWGATAAAAGKTAKTITLSFWVQSSVTGTYGASLTNSAFNRWYPFSYSIPVANIWTQISVTIAGDTTGTWATDNSTGIQIEFGLGIGSTKQGGGNAWTSSVYVVPTGSSNIVSTNGGTIQWTGVQLEVGTSATGYEYRQYQQELALCQRYAYKAIGFLGIAANTGNTYNVMFQFLVSMRTTPTLDSGGSFSVSGGSAGTPAIFNAGYGNANGDRLYFYNSANNWTAGSGVGLNVLFNAEL